MLLLKKLHSMFILLFIPVLGLGLCLVLVYGKTVLVFLGIFSGDSSVFRVGDHA